MLHTKCKTKSSSPVKAYHFCVTKCFALYWFCDSFKSLSSRGDTEEGKFWKVLMDHSDTRNKLIGSFSFIINVRIVAQIFRMSFENKLLQLWVYLNILNNNQKEGNEMTSIHTCKRKANENI